MVSILHVEALCVYVNYADVLLKLWKTCALEHFT